jgi:hypothetical protein
MPVASEHRVRLVVQVPDVSLDSLLLVLQYVSIIMVHKPL